jgi:hypothetical protein
MRLRWPVAASLAPVGLLVGALIVGPPTSVPNDVRLVEQTPVSTPTNGTDEGASGGDGVEQVDSAGPVPSSEPTTTVAAEPETTVADPETTVAEPETTVAQPTTSAATELDAAARAAVLVVVANATAVSGVAGANATILNDAGFTNTQTTDTAPLPTTVVYTKPGFEAAAGVVADSLVLPREVVLPYPGTPFTALDEDADVLVLVGADRAG